MKFQKLTIISLIPIFWLLLLAYAAQPPFACHPSDPLTKSYPFCKTTLPISQRVQDVISRLTLDEKISQLVNTAPPIPRLGIPRYQWWSEALHGIAYFPANSSTYSIHFNGKIRAATSFPQVTLTAVSFDAHLWYLIGKAIGIEARALCNAGQSIGMTFWAPNINIYRDPQWGRGQETAGEDPVLTGKYAMSYVRGIQGDSFQGGKIGAGGHLQASACCKHFTAYDLDNGNGISRFVFNAKVSLQDLADTYQPPFEKCIKGGKASGMMRAYNRVNGVPNCANYDLLSKTARGQWDFNGYIVSDCDAVAVMYEDQGYVKSPEDAVADALKAGMDVNCGEYLKDYTGAAIKEKKLPVSEIDRALHNLFSVRMRLGLFDGNPAKLPYGDIRSEQVCSKEHQNLALDAARDGIVLLKNTGKFLPFSKSRTKTLAVIGPNANVAETLLGNYNGPPCKTVTPLQGLQRAATEADNNHCQSCKEACCSGASLWRSGRHNLAKYDPQIESILWAGYPGEAGGLALAEIIFGDHNPGGRLPVTWYPQNFTRVNTTDMRMRPDQSSGYPGRTYRFYQGPKVFEFGFGLSYSNYSYEFISVSQNEFYFNQHSIGHTSRNSETIGYTLVSEVSKEQCEKGKFKVKVRVENHGEMAGKRPVLLFVRQARASNGGAIKKLVGFQSVNLNAGERAQIEFELSPCEQLARANKDGEMVIEEGSHFLIMEDQEYEINVII
ncbi:hypothetical protein SLA2020_187840 [Shorea laevis]